MKIIPIIIPENLVVASERHMYLVAALENLVIVFGKHVSCIIITWYEFLNNPVVVCK